jgi:hypothetical protein
MIHVNNFVISITKVQFSGSGMAVSSHHCRLFMQGSIKQQKENAGNLKAGVF